MPNGSVTLAGLADMMAKPVTRVPVTRVIVVDDHHLIRTGICMILRDVPDVEVIGQGDSGEQALELVKSLAPDIVIMDLRMPGIGGLEATRRILQHYPGVKVIVVSAFDEIFPHHLLKAGASGYITKKTDSGEVARAIQTVLDNRVYVSPLIAQDMVLKELNGDNQNSPLAQLSQRELQIAQMITSGHRAAEVAAVLNISSKTISSHKYRIYEKLKVSNDVELTLAAVKYGLVNPSDIL